MKVTDARQMRMPPRPTARHLVLVDAPGPVNRGGDVPIDHGSRSPKGGSRSRVRHRHATGVMESRAHRTSEYDSYTSRSGRTRTCEDWAWCTISRVSDREALAPRAADRGDVGGSGHAADMIDGCPQATARPIGDFWSSGSHELSAGGAERSGCLPWQTAWEGRPSGRKHDGTYLLAN